MAIQIQSVEVELKVYQLGSGIKTASQITGEFIERKEKIYKVSWQIKTIR